MSVSANTSADPDLVQRMELLLHQLDVLPTLSTVAVRLLEQCAGEGFRREEVVPLIASDPALASTVLTMCRHTIPGRCGRITTIAQAVDSLGVEAVRGAVLSTPVMEIDDTFDSPGGERLPDEPLFRREAFWQHSVAVAVLCGNLAQRTALRQVIDADEASLAGLLHDLGALALHVLMPATFDRACGLVESTGMILDRACQHVLGLTTHSAGRRLAEHWRLPHLVGDVLWLHGQPSASLPDLPHRSLIELVTLADAACRGAYVSPAGHLARGEDLGELARPLGLSVSEVERAVAELPGQVEARIAALGLTRRVKTERLLRALSSSGQTLGRLHRRSRRQAGHAGAWARALQAVTRFHDTAAPGGSLVSTLGKVVRSAHEMLGGSCFGMLYQPRNDAPCQIMRFACDGRLLRSVLVDLGPLGTNGIPDLADQVQVSMQALSLFPWLAEHFQRAEDRQQLRLLPLRCDWGVHAVLIHDAPVDGVTDRRQLEALSRTWAATVTAAAHHAGAKKVGEQLAESNRALIETRDALSRREKLASLGEIAAGAAHEMNNPLTVISGRAQLLANRLEQTDLQMMAQQIVEQSHRLSDMISSLRSFAEPIETNREPIDLQEMLNEETSRLFHDQADSVDMEVIVDQEVPTVCIDRDKVGRALRALLQNAVESEGTRHIQVRVQISPLDDRLQILVVDDGMGLTKHALAHAFDPFFSAKTAGRQPGLGLAHARRLIEAHGGRITLENAPTRGAVATIWLADWREGSVEARRVA